MGMLDEIGQLLEDNGLGTQATDLFLGDTPQEAPDEVTTVVETSGLPPLFAHDVVGFNIEQPSFQIYNRAPRYDTARLNAENVFIFLNKQVNVTLSGTFYPRIVAQQSPFSLDRDDNHRAQIVCNYSVRKGLSP